MAKAILKFDLTNQDDLQEFRRMTSSLEMAISLFEILHNTKKKVLSQLESADADEKIYDIVDELYKSFWEICEENNIKIENLIS